MIRLAAFCAALACLPARAPAQWEDLEQYRDPPEAIGAWVADILRGNANPTEAQIDRLHVQCAAALDIWRYDDQANHGDATIEQLTRYARLAFLAVVYQRFGDALDAPAGETDMANIMPALEAELNSLRAAYATVMTSEDHLMRYQLLQDFTVCRFLGGALETNRPDLVEQLGRP